MAALIASRNKKKGAKKGLNFNVVLEAADTADAGMVQMVREYDEDGEVVGVGEVAVPSAGSKKVGALTAALNKQNEAAKPRTTIGAADVVVKPQLAAGEWVEEDETRAPQGPLLAPGSRAVLTDLDGLSSSVPDPSKPREQLEAEEESRKLFHWTRKQALVEAEAKAAAAAAGVVEAPAEKKPAFFRPREMMEREGKKDGKDALKELNNEQVFPTLGGAPRKVAGPASAGSVWGVVKQDVLDEIEIKQKDGIYLGADFLAAHTFEGGKVGYAFSNGAMGVGYYWEGPKQANSEPGRAAEPIAAAIDAEASQSQQQQEGTQEQGADTSVAGPAPEPAPAPAPSAPSPSPTMLDARARAAQAAEEKRVKEEELRRKEEEEKESRRKAKKAEKEREKAEWEAEQHRLRDKEAAEAKAKVEAAAAPATAATDAPADEAGLEDRFAGLKKKKKKKPAAGEDAEE